MVSLEKNRTRIYSELIERIRRGDKKATIEFYYELLPLCRKIILKQIHYINGEELQVMAHEITTDVILKKLSRFDTSRDFVPFIWRVIINLITDNFRKNKRSIFVQKNLIELKENNLSFSTEILDKEEESFYQEKLELINRLINDLPIEKKQLIFDYYFANKSIKLISAETKCSVPAITSNLHRIRSVLRLKMAEFGYKTKKEK